MVECDLLGAIMGQVVVDLPQNINRYFRVKDLKFGQQLLRELEENASVSETPAILPPRRKTLKSDGDEVLGIWSDREETADEIARRIRDGNSGKYVKPIETITLEYPYDLDDIDESEAIGIWKDRKESAEEIARTIREKNRRVT